jgi:hypothetical protein
MKNDSQGKDNKGTRCCDLESSGLGCGPVLGFCEQGNEPLIFVKDWEFLDGLSLLYGVRGTKIIELKLIAVYLELNSIGSRLSEVCVGCHV